MQSEKKDLKVGDYIKWEQMNGVKHRGYVFEIDNDVAYVECEEHPNKLECACDNI